MFKKIILSTVSFILSIILISGCSYTFFTDGSTPLDTAINSEQEIVARESDEIFFTKQADETTSSGDNYAELVAKNMMSCVVSIYATTSNTENIGAGTGFIISNDGYVITNAHVLMYTANIYEINWGRKILKGQEQRQHNTIYALFNKSYIDNTIEKSMYYKLEILKIDTKKDLAVLKFINDFNYYTDNTKTTFNKGFQKYCNFVDSATLKYGQKVVAIGNAQDYGLSVTTGVISMPYNEKFSSIQTNTSINPGNSGGPLFDENGEVVGVVSSKIVDSTVEGIGFAIPSNVVKEFIVGIIA